MKRTPTSFGIILLLLSLLIPFQIEAQKFTREKFETRLKEFLQSSPWEEIYLHTDRDKYIAGEDIWFSIYALGRETGKLSARSAIVYVELLNPWNIPLIQKRFKLNVGRGEGSFLLPDSISSGTYTIRAYTNWMKNFHPDNSFIHYVDIYNPFGSLVFRSKGGYSGNEIRSLDLKFFPEGGNLLNGTINKVATRCINYLGEGVLFTGIIKDNKGDSITCFTTNRSGYGSFFFSPENGKNYYVSATGKSFMLPEAKNDGLSVNVHKLSNGRSEIVIAAAGSYVLPSSNTFFFLILKNGKIDYMTSLKIKDIFTKISLPENILDRGVSQIVLIGEDGRLMSERLIYSHRISESRVVAETDSIYGRREKISLRLGISNNNVNQQKITEMSVSVVPAQISAICRGIDDYMIFGTEFGRTPWSDKKISFRDLDMELVDNFLICSKSRWILWEDLSAGKSPHRQYEFENSGHYLSLIVRYREDNLIDSADFLYMSIQGKVAEFNYASRNASGRFTFIMPVDNKPRNLILQPENANTNMMLEIVPSFSRILPESLSFNDTLSVSQIDEFSGLSFNYQAAKIYGVSLNKEVVEDDVSNLKSRRFYGIPEMEIFLDEYISLPVMQEVFFELVPGIILRPGKSGYEIKITNPLTGIYYSQPPLVMIDGVIINDLAVLVDLNPEIVEKIEVVKTPYLIGDLILYGIVNVITRSGDFSDIIVPDYAVVLPYRVVEKHYGFNAPDYDDKQRKLSRVPDLRNTLYWNPSVKTESNGEVEIEFWTSDLQGIYTINVQGVSEAGEIVSLCKTFMVK